MKPNPQQQLVGDTDRQAIYAASRTNPAYFNKAKTFDLVSTLQ
jgi:hypothetical protein